MMQTDKKAGPQKNALFTVEQILDSRLENNESSPAMLSNHIRKPCLKRDGNIENRNAKLFSLWKTYLFISNEAWKVKIIKSARRLEHTSFYMPPRCVKVKSADFVFDGSLRVYTRSILALLTRFLPSDPVVSLYGPRRMRMRQERRRGAQDEE